MKLIPLFMWFSLGTMFVGYKMAMWQVSSGGNWNSNNWAVVAIVLVLFALGSSVLSIIVEADL